MRKYNTWIATSYLSFQISHLNEAVPKCELVHLAGANKYYWGSFRKIQYYS